MGVGFTLGIAIIAFIRELLGSGSIAGIGLLKSNEFILVMILAPGALLTMGLLIALSRLMGLTKR